MRLIKIVAVSSLLVGCASHGGFNSAIPQKGQKMVEIYDGVRATSEISVRYEDKKPVYVKDNSPPSVREFSVVGIPLNENVERKYHNETEQMFPRASNPDIRIFVFPHLATQDEVPIPGYTTAIPLHRTVEYLMPGERAQMGYFR